MLSTNKLNYIDSLFLLEQAKELVPGLKKALSFYYDPFEKKIVASVMELGHNNIDALLNLEDDFDLHDIMSYRKGKQTISWLKESDLPFSLKKNKNIQKHVFDELDNIILLLRFPNKDDAKMDLIYLFLNADASNFGLRKSSDILKTENKSIIGHLIYNSFKQILSQRKILTQKNNDLKNHYSLIQSKLEEQSLDNHTRIQDIQKQITNYCTHLISTHSKKMGVHIELGEQLKEVLSEYKGTIQELDKLISLAIIRANDTNIDILSPVLNLEEWHFDNLNQEIYDVASSPFGIGPDSRYYNTYTVLERYETSARKLVSRREKLTGANVGKALSSPISAAAITDFIKKNQDKINTLCKKYPNQWKIIRSEFRPLMNVLRA